MGWGSSTRRGGVDMLAPSINHRVLQGAPLRERQLYFTFSSAPNPSFKASKAPFLTLRVATPSGAPRQALLESKVCFPWVSREGTWHVAGILQECSIPVVVFKKCAQKKFVLILGS